MNVFIKLEKNKLFFRNTKTNIEYEIITEKPISYNGILIANIENAIEYIKNGINKVMPKNSFIKPNVYLMPMKDLNEISQIEQNAIIDVIYKAGARGLIVIDNESDINKNLEMNKLGSFEKIENNARIFDRNFRKGIIQFLIFCILGIIFIIVIRLL